MSVGVDSLRAKIRDMLGGLESELSIVVDVMLPAARVVDSMQAFEKEFPTVALRLHVEALGAVTQLVVSGVASVGISGPEHRGLAGLEQVRVGGVELIPVAAPTHPLAKSESNPPGAARDHVQLVLADRSTLTEGKDFGVVGVKSWRLADLGAKQKVAAAYASPALIARRVDDPADFFCHRESLGGTPRWHSPGAGRRTSILHRALHSPLGLSLKKSPASSRS